MTQRSNNDTTFDKYMIMTVMIHSFDLSPKYLMLLKLYVTSKTC